MKDIIRGIRPTRLALVVAAAGLLPLAAQAQTPSMSDFQARYQQDMQRCATMSDPEAQRTCRREAGAALQEARRDRLVRGNVDPQSNLTARCARLPAERRADCQRLMTDGSSVEHGSVSGGGVLRELSITVPLDSTTGTPGAYGSTAPATGGSYGTPAPSSYGNTAPAPSGYGTQPGAGYNTPAAPGGYGTQPAR